MDSKAGVFLEYGNILREHVKDIMRSADKQDDRDEAARLRSVASALEWVIALSIPNQVIVEFPILYRAAQDSEELYQALIIAYGTQENVEIAARMKNLRE